MAGERHELDRILAADRSIEMNTTELADLVYSEYFYRRQHEAVVDPEEYYQRFPHIAEILRNQFALCNEVMRISPDFTKLAVTHLSANQLAADTVANLSVSLESTAPRGFEPIEIIGHGGMGVVVKAWQNSLRREVAIKSLKGSEWARESDRARLRTEAHVVAKLQHPNVVQIFDVVEENGKLFLVMEYVDGTSLSQAIVDGSLRESIARTLRSVVAGVEAAHAAGFLHRDIKPRNILMSSTGAIKVTDFGLARSTCEPSMSLTGETLGTPAYMAPEQVAGKKTDIDERTDVYGIGATLYEMLTGRPPFVGSSTAETLQQVLFAEPVRPRALVPNVHRDLESICMKCLEKKSALRYQSAAELRSDLDRFLDGRATLVRPVSNLERARRWIVSHPMQSLTALGLLASIMVLVGATTWFVTNVASLKLVTQSREVALSESRQREELSSFYALSASIQARTSEKRVGWTWQNIEDICAAIKQVPNNTEKDRLRQFLIQSLTSFDVRKTGVMIEDIDPYGLAWSPNGNWLAIGENMSRPMVDGTSKIVVHVLGKAPARELKEILLPKLEPDNASKGPEGVRSLVFIDDLRLAVGCRSGWIQIVNIETGESIASFRAHSDFCYAMVHDAKRHWIVSSSRDGSISLWNSEDYSKISAAVASGPSVRSLGIVGDRLISLGENLDAFDLPELTTVVRPVWNDKSLCNLKVVPGSDSLLVTGTRNSFIATPESESIRDLYSRNQSDQVANYHYIDFHSNPRWGSISGADSVRFLDLLRGEGVYTLPVPGSGAKYSTYDPHLDRVVITNNKQLLQYELRLPAVWHHLQTPAVRLQKRDSTYEELEPNSFSKIASIQSKNESGTLGRVLVHNIPKDATKIEYTYYQVSQELTKLQQTRKVSFGGEHWKWDAVLKELSSMKIELTPQISIYQTASCFSVDGNRFWIADREKVEDIDVRVGRLLVFNTNDGRLEKHWLNRDSAINVRISTFEQIVCGARLTITISGDRILRIYDSEALELVSEIPLGGKAVLKVAAMSEDESTAYVGVQDGRVLCVDLKSKAISQVVERESEITAISLSREGVLAIGNRSGEVDLYAVNRSTVKHLCQISTQNDTIELLEFSKDGSQLAMLVAGERGCHTLDWKEFRRRLAGYELDFE